MVVKKITLTNFKGCKEATYLFGKNATYISGQNGSGKSTVMDGWIWLWFDKDSNLVSNPNIRPLVSDEESLEVSVAADIDIDGKPITVKKIQKKKVSKDGKVSLTNTYEVNSVPKSQRDFQLYFEELGIDWDKFLQLSHPDVFVNGMSDKKSRENMRNTLFQMASTISDYEVAEKTQDVEGLKQLLKDYSLEEIQAMQAATIRKIKSDYGTDGEIIDAEIRGKEALRYDIDLAELELQKKEINSQLETNKEKLADVNKIAEEYNSLSSDILELNFKLSEIAMNANKDVQNSRIEHQRKIDDATNELNKANAELHTASANAQSLNLKYSFAERELTKCREEYTKVFNEQFDENSVVCPTCGQALPEDKALEIRNTFEESKKSRINNIIVSGNAKKTALEEVKSEIEKNNNLFDGLREKIADLENKVTDLKSVVFKEVNYKEFDEYKAILSQIAAKEELMKKANSQEDVQKEILDSNQALNNQLIAIEKQFALVEGNEKIDTQISELQSKKLQLAQEKANCEKILYEIDLLNKRKNELLTDQINSHFNIVKWRLFKYLKNGTYEQDCTPTSIDGKVIGEATNNALTIAMKLDIIDGLQKFFTQSYPVWIDNFEAIDSANAKNLKIDSQLICLKVTDETSLTVMSI